MRDWMTRVCSRCNASTALIAAGIAVFAVLATSAGPASQHAALVMQAARDAAAVVLVSAGYALPMVTAWRMSREPASVRRRASSRLPYVPPPPPGYGVPDALAVPAEKIPVPPPAPAVLSRSVRNSCPAAGPARPEPARPQMAADDRDEVIR